jgi:thiol-disulfide isomerase/thioredoxin
VTSFARAGIWALVIVLAAVAGFLAYGWSGRGRLSDIRVSTSAPIKSPQPGADFTSEPATISDDGLPPGHPPVARRVPERLPDFTLQDSHGENRTLAHWKDRPLIVNFWATWCEPCRREIPLLKKLRQEHAGHGVEVIGIAVDFRDAVIKYGRDMGIDYPMLIGEQEGLEAIEAFGMEPVFPFTVFSDRHARIVAIKVGELHADEAALILERVQALDSGKLDLQDAKTQIADGLREISIHRARSETAHEPHDPH